MVEKQPTGGDGGRPIGKTRNPILVVVFALVTFGLYGLYWVWSIAKEVDAFDPHRESPYDLATWGLGLLLAGSLGYLAGFAGSFAGVASGSEAGLGAGIVVVAIGGLLGLLGSVVLVVAIWRVWQAVEAHETATGAPSTLSPVLMLVLWLVPGVNLFGLFYVPYRTQQGLNRVWEAVLEGYEPAPSEPTGAYAEAGGDAAA